MIGAINFNRENVYFNDSERHKMRSTYIRTRVFPAIISIVFDVISFFRLLLFLLGKRLNFIGTLKCFWDALEKEGDESILEAASGVFENLVSTEGGEQDAAETQTGKLFEDIPAKVSFVPE